MSRALPTQHAEQLLVDCVLSGMEAVLPQYTCRHALDGNRDYIKSSLCIQLDGHGNHMHDVSTFCVWKVKSPVCIQLDGHGNHMNDASTFA
jgi:hypothetical protein